MKKIFVFVVLCLITTQKVWTQYDKTEVFNKIKKKYANSTAVSINFCDAKHTSACYFLQAKKGNKFNLKSGNRRIVCDGKTLWNYSITNKNVVISDFEEGVASFTLDYFFFEIFPNLIPTSFKSELSSSKKKSYVLSLRCENQNTGVNTVNLSLTPDFTDIKELELVGDMGTQSWIIKKIKVNPKLENSTFNFKVPEKVEVIDYRL